MAEDVAQTERFRRMGEIVWLLRHAPPDDRADLELVEALWFRPPALGRLRLGRRRPVASTSESAALHFQTVLIRR